MLSLKQVSQYLLDLRPTPWRQALVSYLQYFCVGHSFGVQHLQHFYALAMGFEFWQREQSQLIEGLTQDFLEIQNQLPAPLNRSRVCQWLPATWLHLDSAQEIRNLMQNYAHKKSRHYQFSDSVFIPHPPGHALFLGGNSQGLKVELMSPLAFVVKGHVHAGVPVGVLVYDHNLDLSTRAWQRIFVPGLGHVVFRFCVPQVELGRFSKLGQAPLCKGWVFKGPELKKEKFAQFFKPSDFFYYIKSLESHFLDLNTDAFYQSLMGSIKTAVKDLRLGHPDAIINAQKTWRKAYEAASAFKHDANFCKWMRILQKNQMLLGSQQCLQRTVAPPNRRMMPRVQYCTAAIPRPIQASAQTHSSKPPSRQRYSWRQRRGSSIAPTAQ